MKISILFLALFAYFVNASEESGRDEKPSTKHGVHTVGNIAPYQTGYIPVYQPGYALGYQPDYQPLRRRVGQGSRDRLILAIFIKRMIDSYNAANTDLATDAPATDAPETTMDPLTGWTRIGTCYYLLTSTAETWNDADSACKAAISGGRLAVVGFNQASAARSALINAAGAASTTFWIGATGEVDDSAGIDNPTFITPLFGADPTGGSADFVAELADSSAEDSDVCGRVSATDTDKLRFEDCATREFRSMCEYCG